MFMFTPDTLKIFIQLQLNKQQLKYKLMQEENEYIKNCQDEELRNIRKAGCIDAEYEVLESNYDGESTDLIVKRLD